MVEMRSINRSQREAMVCPCQSFQSLFIQSYNSIPFSGPESIDVSNKLRDISDRIESAGDVGVGGGKVVSELVDEIRAAIAHFQVSNKIQTSHLHC